MIFSIRFIVAAGLVSPTFAGPFPPAAGQPGSDAIPADDSRFTVWASSCVVESGPTDIADPESFPATYGLESAATGPADANPDWPYPVVSLGDGGTATLEFAQPFGDVPGPDLAVFENSFGASFFELAHVEVSSDGVNYFRFPARSLTEPGGNVDPTNVRNLAGKYFAGFGTPFDLAELRQVSPLLDIQRITHVRIIDAVGTNDPDFATHDAAGNIVVDPYPTPYPSCGFDLDAVGAFSQTATTYAAWLTAQGITDMAPSADSNHDGVPNLIEYLTGRGRVVAETFATLKFPRLSYRTDGNLRVEGSPDLQQWTPLAESNHGATMVAKAAGTIVSESGDSVKQTTVTLSPGTPYKFFRLAAEP
ncbi:MAG: hypothetical protein Q8Q59_11665 [Luteolibacter sp.]|jgi:hypothetical protein|nr:hypothetical protein [Luteolibacter sp.]